MAEQDSHNVVMQSESASGSVPLVDAALINTITSHAADGINTHMLDPSRLTNDLEAPSQQAFLTTGHDLVSLKSEEVATTTEAEPSAGNAVISGANAAQERVQELVNHRDELDVSAEPSVSSDNEAGRSESVDPAKDSAQHNRTNSVKRPATFSKVSVTKNFLAKSATATPIAVKVGDKSAPAVMAAPVALKPRLVAKSAMSLGNALRSRNGAENSPGPDAGTVWNKNRPAPAMPAKQFTDEELKQQYGIHLATRLQTDENGKGSKWADIDDDEDDWAPEAVVWMDGTKSSLTPAEIPVAPILAKAASPAPAQPTNTSRPSLAAMKKPGDGSGTVKTILKPGAAAQAKQQTGQDSSTTVLERHSLKAKSSAPVPTKSPWASLPPVDKVSPVNPPVQVQQAHHPPPFASQDARNMDMPASNNFSAREIAADTFDRSWREGEGERRELFNSTSGKYEPAPEGRRNSIKQDPYGRKPSVLSRGSGYAESGRLNGIESNFSHRRGSSVSHGSGPSARRMSCSRGSDSVVSDHQPGPASQDVRAAPISQQSPWQQQLPPPPGPGEEAEDPVKTQERVMREKLQAARQRRQEEEAQQEAAKQERLKAKLKELANAGLSRKERQQAAVEMPVPHAEASSGLATSEDHVKSPDADIAAPATAALADVTKDLPATSQMPVVSPSALDATPVDASPLVQPREHLSPGAASRSTFQSQNSGSYRTTQTSAFSSPGDRERKLQPFGRSPVVNHDTFAPWPTAVSSSNVWGSSGIGNGTFEGASLFAPMASSQQLSSLPPPPGMGRSAASSRISPHSPNLPEAQMSDTSRILPSAIGQQRVNGAAPSGMGRQQHVPGPIGPPSRAQPQHQGVGGVSAWQAAARQMPQQYQLEADEAMRLPEPTIEHKRERVFKETFIQTGLQSRLGGPRAFDKTEYTIHDAQGSRAMPLPPNAQSQPSGPDVTSSPLQTWKQPVESAVRLPDGSLNPAHGGRAQQQPPIAPPSVAALPRHMARKPNFTTAPLAPAPAISNDSPPPPETTSHPVYSGFTHHPHVRLPQPPPVVKLPPAPSTQMLSPAVMSQRSPQSWGPLGVNQPIVKNGEWQARFNGLFNRAPIQTEVPPSPPKTPPKAFAPVLAVASSSRTLMDDANVIRGATVSLPRGSSSYHQRSDLFTVDDSSAVTSKDMVQYMFNDELGFGSRPKVRIAQGYQAPAQQCPFDATIAVQKLSPVEAQSKIDPSIFSLFYKKPEGYYIKLPGSTSSRFARQDPKRNSYQNRSTRPRRDVSGKKEFNNIAPGPSSSSLPTSRKTSTPRGSTSTRSDSKTSTPQARKRSGLHKTSVKPSPASLTPVMSS